VDYTSSSIVSSIESSMDRILNHIGPRLPPLSRLAILIDSAFDVGFRNEKIRRATDIPAEIACASMDALLAQYPPSPISTIAILCDISLWQLAQAAPALETFRQDGLDALREVFPRLSAGPRRQVYDSKVAKRWQHRGQASAVLFSGIFSVVSTAATP
jgi:hypothetical protein